MLEESTKAGSIKGWRSMARPMRTKPSGLGDGGGGTCLVFPRVGHVEKNEERNAEDEKVGEKGEKVVATPARF